MKISIIALNEKGENAITENVLIMKKSRAKKIMIKKLGFSYGVEGPPKTLFFRLSGMYERLVKSKDLVRQFTEDMEEKGAKENIDFKIEVEE